MLTKKTTFDPSDCRMVVETSHCTQFNTLDVPELDQITIRLFGSDNLLLGTAKVVRIPSNQRVNASELYGTFYDMGAVMRNENRELRLIADEMELGWSFRTTHCRSGLDRNDLYQVVELFVMSSHRKKGVGTWMLSNMQMMLSRITHDREPVCVLVPPSFEENGNVIYTIDDWVKELYTKTGWEPVKDGARTLYLNPMC